MALKNKQLKYPDMRGAKYASNYIEVINGVAYYAGYKVTDLQRRECCSSKLLYNIFGAPDIVLGYIAYYPTDANKLSKIILK